jgi:hypothetical protein
MDMWKKTMAVLLSAVVMLLTSCAKKTVLVPTQYPNDTGWVEALVNYSIISSAQLPNYIDSTVDDNGIVLEMILDYNESNDKDKFKENNGKILKRAEIKKKMIILANNLP